MLDVLITFAAGLGFILAIFIVSGGIVFFATHVLSPIFDWIGKNYPRFSGWAQVVFVVVFALFIIYYLGMMVTGKL